MAEDRLFDFGHDTPGGEVGHFNFRRAIGSWILRPKPNRAVGHHGRADRDNQGRAEGLGAGPLGHDVDVGQEDCIAEECFEVSEGASEFAWWRREFFPG